MSSSGVSSTGVPTPLPVLLAYALPPFPRPLSNLENELALLGKLGGVAVPGLERGTTILRPSLSKREVWASARGTALEDLRRGLDCELKDGRGFLEAERRFVAAVGAWKRMC